MNLMRMEKEMLARARIAACNWDLEPSDILEWAFGDIQPRKGEVVVPLHEMGCNICIPKQKDRRK